MPSERTAEAEVRYYLDRARRGDTEAAYHGLIELPDGGLPTLEGAYAGEPDPALRALIVEAAWQHRRASSVGFLAVALRDPDPEAWKRALDGLVTLATPEARRAVEQLRDRVGDVEEYRGWLAEAILQIDEASPV